VIKLSVIAVNHNSSSLLKECFSSIVSAIGNEPFEFFAIDSGSDEEDVKNLRNLEKDNVTIILNNENIGYARAVNTGIKKAKGDLILITNPDVVYMPGSIRNMSHVLKQFPRCGAVGPRTWWNRNMTFLLPYSDPFTPHRRLETGLMRISHVMNNIILKKWIRKMLRFWLSEEPLKQETLSGACIMTTQKVLGDVGGFDDSFPLYFEDTDWCVRVRKAGYYLYLAPDAKIIHYYNQSAGQDTETSQKKFDESLNLYMGKHYRSQLWLINTMTKLFEDRHNRVLKEYNDLGRVTSPPAFSFTDRSKKLFLLSPVDILIPSAGSFFENKTFQIPEDLWSLLSEGRYFAKGFDLVHSQFCGSWSWMRHAPAKSRGRNK
jgi:GT2 family glycosyltransferase